MVKVAELIVGIDRWTQDAKVGLHGGVPRAELGRAVEQGLQLYRGLREVIDEWSDPRAPLDLERARTVESLLSRWLAAAKPLAADVAKTEAAGALVDGAAAMDRSILYAQHAVSFSVDDEARQQDRIDREGFRRGVTTEALRRELLQGRVGN